jgi:hypothetical protein
MKMLGQPPSQYPPPHEWDYLGAPKPKRSEKQIVVIVLVTVAIVVIATVVVAAVLYIMVSGLTDGGGATRPVVTFQAPAKGGGASNYTTNISIAAASDPISTFLAFKGQVARDGVPLATIPAFLRTGTLIAFGPNVTLIVRDQNGDGRLNTRDSFLIYGMTGVHAWRFSLIWSSDGSEIVSSTWSTP